MDCSPPGSSVHGIFQEEYWSGLPCLPPRKSVSIATPISLSTSVSMFTPISMCVCVCVHAMSLQLCPTLVTLWTVAHQAPLSMGFSRQKNWSMLPCPALGSFSDPGIKSVSPALTGGFFINEPPGNPRLFGSCQQIVNWQTGF